MVAKVIPETKIDPYIPSHINLPEITPRAVILGILLAILLAASSTFVGLKIARTIAGSIPAALISMLVLRQFKTANILENNMVQTIASAGETVAAGVIFTMPALILMRFWQSFDYFQTALITIIGGVLGVMFSVPLRRSMIVIENLPYPEGLATAEVLKCGESAKGATKILFQGSIFAAIISFLQTGFKIASEQVQYWVKIGSGASGLSLMMSPVLMAAGFIVGIRGLIAFVVGGILTWAILVPWFVMQHGGVPPEVTDLGAYLSKIQKDNFRFVAVGVLAVGGIWGVVSLIGQIRRALKASMAAIKSHPGENIKLPRTDRDIPMFWVVVGVLAIAVPIFFLFFTLVDNANLNLHSSTFWWLVIFATIFSLVVGFIVSAIAAYIVGIVGTTSLPVSGITIACIIAFSTVVLAILGNSIDFKVDTEAALKVSSIVILFAAIVCVASSLGGDNLQDLKAGQLVGATPWKQQLMLLIGAIASALVIPIILQTTFEAYGIGDVLPREGMVPGNALPAPQATLMATIAQGFFAGNLPWPMIEFGAVLAVIGILIDEYLRRKNSRVRFPVLLLALGIYFPLSYVTAFFIGGLISYWVERRNGIKAAHDVDSNGILFASGIIAGDAILGALLTIPFAYFQSTDVFAINIPGLAPYANAIAIVLFVALCIALYNVALNKKRAD